MNTVSIGMEPTICNQRSVNVLQRDSGSCSVEGTRGDGGEVCTDRDSSISLVSPGVPNGKYTDIHVVAGNCYYRSIVLPVDDGAVLLFSMQINRFIDMDCFIIASVEHEDHIVCRCLHDTI